MNKIFASLLMIGLVLGVAGAGTWAVFTDGASSTGNTFTAGTLEVTLTEPGAWSAGFNNMKPGETKTFSITVNSVGTLPLNYDVGTVLGGVLAGGVTPVAVTGVRIDGAAATSGSLDAIGGADASDEIQIDVTMPVSAGNDYQGQSGTLSVTVNAVQQ